MSCTPGNASVPGKPELLVIPSCFPNVHQLLGWLYYWISWALGLARRAQGWGGSWTVLLVGRGRGPQPQVPPGLGWGHCLEQHAALGVAWLEEELHPHEPLATFPVLQEMGNPDPPVPDAGSPPRSLPFDLPNTRLQDGA